ncbi:MAG: O-antigen ligase family protein [Thiolinea sp.]
MSAISIHNLISIRELSKKTAIALTLLFLWGSIITLKSPSIKWSVIEFLLFVSLAITITTTNYKNHHFIIKFLAILFSLIQALYITRSFLNYSFIVINQDTVDVWNIIDGFSNIRFYAQFLSWTLPFILAYTITNNKERYKNLLFSIVIASWIFVLMSGTRAFILGIFSSIIAVALITPGLWVKYTKSVILTGLLGFLGYFLLIHFLPALLGLDNSAALNSTTDRNFTSSSGRIKIWQDTLSIIINHPLIGIGPMMTAMEGVLDKVAHPHNFPLQLAAEWGIPFAVTVLLLLLYASLQWRKAINQAPKSRESLALPVTAATSSAMSASLVDGIIVMPVSLLYMSIIIGIGFSLWRQWSPLDNLIKIPKLALNLSTIIPLSFLLITLLQWQDLSNDRNLSNKLEPRFWLDGKIRNDHSNPNNFFKDNSTKGVLHVE